MHICHIFCAAEFSGLLQPPKAGDLILAADGGLRHTQALGISPDIILGDFDSLGYIPDGGNVLLHPVEKDDTDAMLAARLGLQRGYRRFLFYGALDGPRLDHTIANLHTLGFLATHNACGCLVGKTCLAAAFAPGTLRFSAVSTGIISLFCLGEPVKGLHIEGLKYPLTSGSLTADFPLGVSNHFQDVPASVHWDAGQLLALFDRGNPLPAYQPG